MADDLSKLAKPLGATKPKTRRGRGVGSGLGKTAGRGQKGQYARTRGFKRGFEGGQTPIQRRLPKRGFNNIHRVEYKVFNLGQIDQLVEKYSMTEFTPENLYINGLIGQTDLVKVLGTGELKSKIPFKVNAVSGKAKTAIEGLGATIEILK